MDGLVAAPRSRAKIREFTRHIRETVGVTESPYISIVDFLEKIMPRVDKEFFVIISSMDDMGDCHGLAHPDKHCIELREDIYEGAINGEGRDRFTIAHEIGHYLMHRPGTVSHARMDRNKAVPAYMNPEWQANTFAAELLMPADMIRGKSPTEVMLICGVSYTAAEIQLKNI